MDEDVKQAIDELRDELRELGRARNAPERRQAERDVQHAREDLEDVLRREGYRISRRELDALMDAEDERRFNERIDKRLAEILEAQKADDGDGDEEDGDDDGDDAKKTTKKKAAKKDGEKPDEEAEWT